MQRIGVYDDTSDFIEEVCEQLDLTEPEVIDELIDYYVSTHDEDDGIVRLYNRMFMRR